MSDRFQGLLGGVCLLTLSYALIQTSSGSKLDDSWQAFRLKERPSMLYLRRSGVSQSKSLIEVIKNSYPGLHRLVANAWHSQLHLPLGKQSVLEAEIDRACTRTSGASPPWISLQSLDRSLVVSDDIRDHLVQRLAYTRLVLRDKPAQDFTVTALIANCHDPQGIRFQITQQVGGEYFIPMLFTYGNQASHRYAEMKEDELEEDWQPEARLEERQRIDAEMLRMQVFISRVATEMAAAFSTWLQQEPGRTASERVAGPAYGTKVRERAREMHALLQNSQHERNAIYTARHKQYPEAYIAIQRVTGKLVDDPLRPILDLQAKRSPAQR